MMVEVLLLAAAATFAPATGAQSPFADVPSGHWAAGAVNELQSRGIVSGYPDGTFGGTRAVTRYEFALAGQHVIQEVQRRLDAGHAAPPRSSAAPGMTREEVDRFLDERLSKLPTRGEIDRLHADVEQLRRTMGGLQSSAAALREEVDQMRRELGSLDARASGIAAPRSRGSDPHP